MLTIFSLVLFGSITLVCIPYSLLLDDSIFMGFLIYVASPPLVLSVLRLSITVYPSSVGASTPLDIHVSYIHKMSISSYSSTSNNFK